MFEKLVMAPVTVILCMYDTYMAHLIGEGTSNSMSIQVDRMESVSSVADKTTKVGFSCPLTTYQEVTKSSLSRTLGPLIRKPTQKSLSFHKREVDDKKFNSGWGPHPIIIPL